MFPVTVVLSKKIELQSDKDKITETIKDVLKTKKINVITNKISSSKIKISFVKDTMNKSRGSFMGGIDKAFILIDNSIIKYSFSMFKVFYFSLIMGLVFGLIFGITTSYYWLGFVVFAWFFCSNWISIVIKNKLFLKELQQELIKKDNEKPEYFTLNVEGI